MTITTEAVVLVAVERKGHRRLEVEYTSAKNLQETLSQVCEAVRNVPRRKWYFATTPRVMVAGQADQENQDPAHETRVPYMRVLSQWNLWSAVAVLLATFAFLFGDRGRSAISQTKSYCLTPKQLVVRTSSRNIILLTATLCAHP